MNQPNKPTKEERDVFFIGQSLESMAFYDKQLAILTQGKEKQVHMSRVAASNNLLAILQCEPEQEDIEHVRKELLALVDDPLYRGAANEAIFKAEEQCKQTMKNYAE